MSNIDIIRTVTAELATKTRAQVTGWRWAEGVVVFPDIRCPYCKQGVRSPAIWKHTETHLIGQVVPRAGEIPKLERPSHAHVVTDAGGICFGRAKTAYQALFGALNGTSTYHRIVAPFLDSPLMGNHRCEEMDAVRDEDTVVCARCEDDIDQEDAYEFNDNYYCNDCFSEVAFSCWNCGESYPIDDQNTGSNDYDYCGDCWRERFFSCAKCYNPYRIDDALQTPDGPYCDDCYGENYFGCDRCGETTANDDRADYDDETLCQSCFDIHFTKCEDCDEVYKDADGHDCPKAEWDDWREGILSDAKDLVMDAVGDLPKGTRKGKRELLERVLRHLHQRYIDAPPEKEETE